MIGVLTFWLSWRAVPCKFLLCRGIVYTHTGESTMLIAVQLLCGWCGVAARMVCARAFAVTWRLWRAVLDRIRPGILLDPRIFDMQNGEWV
jgi:hypothetical protein